MSPIIEIADLHVFYGKVEAVRGATLAMDRGQIVTMIDASLTHALKADSPTLASWRQAKRATVKGAVSRAVSGGAAVGGGPTPADLRPSNDLAALQGMWFEESMEVGGQAVMLTGDAYRFWTFAGNELTFGITDEQAYSIAARTATQPATFVL